MDQSGRPNGKQEDRLLLSVPRAAAGSYSAYACMLLKPAPGGRPRRRPDGPTPPPFTRHHMPRDGSRSRSLGVGRRALTPSVYDVRARLVDVDRIPAGLPNK
jgi:hypothetical protein